MADSDKVRDHLANERTFLAWVRTSLGLIGLGFLLARMGLFLRQIALSAAPASVHGFHAGHEFLISGVVFLTVGTLLCGWSSWMYDRNRRAIHAGQFEPALRSVLALTVVVVLGGVVIIGLVVWRMVMEG